MKKVVFSEHQIAKLVLEAGLPVPEPRELIHVNGRLGIVYQLKKTWLVCLSRGRRSENGWVLAVPCSRTKTGL